MTTYRVGGSWKTHTIVLEGSEPADEKGKRPDDLPVAWVDSAAPEGLAERICRLLNADEPETTACDCGAEGLSARFHREGCPAVACNCGHEGLDPKFHIDCPAGRRAT